MVTFFRIHSRLLKSASPMPCNNSKHSFGKTPITAARRPTQFTHTDGNGRLIFTTCSSPKMRLLMKLKRTLPLLPTFSCTSPDEKKIFC